MTSQQQRTFINKKIIKRQYKQLFIININSTLRSFGPHTTYNVAINLLKKQHILLNSKMLAQLAQHNPKIFHKLFYQY